MKKTYWTVELAVWGADRPVNHWFDNYKEAKEFAKQDYTGKPVKHTYTTQKSIEMAERYCMYTREDMEAWN